jgi:hypothetical protein
MKAWILSLNLPDDYFTFFLERNFNNRYNKLKFNCNKFLFGVISLVDLSEYWLALNIINRRHFCQYF